ncbi:MAG TPA: prefoldin subunit alpha [Candidatus Bathyarchaeota archaeon]|nr:prefoldin subunit alpha [Candidatus Bathyarchaeota archaeon]
MSSDEETFRRLAVESRFLEEAVNELQSRISLTNSALTELRISSITMEGLEKEKKDSQLFVPIGGGSYVKARLETANKVVVGVGADVAVERTLKEAKEELEARIAELEKTREALVQQFNQVVERIQENRDRFEEVTAKLREGEGQSGVREAKKRA